MKFPDLKIGEVTVAATMQQGPVQKTALEPSAPTPDKTTQASPPQSDEWLALLKQLATQLVKVSVLGNDRKLYGPVPAAKLLEWAVEKRIGPDTLAQLEGTSAWQPLSVLLRNIKVGQLRSPPAVPRSKTGFRIFGPNRKG